MLFHRSSSHKGLTGLFSSREHASSHNGGASAESAVDARAAELSAAAEPCATDADVAPLTEDELASDASVPACRVLMGPALGTRDEVLRYIAREAVELGIAGNAQELLAAFLRREAEGTTGMMDGFAIPHAKTAGIEHATILVLKDRIGVRDWETMDDEPVRVVIALLIPGQQTGTTYLKLLSKVAESLMDDDFRATVKEATDPETIERAVNAHLMG